MIIENKSNEVMKEFKISGKLLRGALTLDDVKNPDFMEILFDLALNSEDALIKFLGNEFIYNNIFGGEIYG